MNKYKWVFSHAIDCKCTWTSRINIEAEDVTKGVSQRVCPNCGFIFSLQIWMSHNYIVTHPDFTSSEIPDGYYWVMNCEHKGLMRRVSGQWYGPGISQPFKDEIIKVIKEIKNDD